MIKFHFLAPCPLSARFLLKAQLVSIFKRERQSLEQLTIIFCDDAYVLSLNQKFLQHDYFTDILSFPLSPPGEPLLAEIYISIDRVRENALDNHASFNQELHRVIFHGVLHFCGYRDKTPGQIVVMRQMEDQYLRKYFSKIPRR